MHPGADEPRRRDRLGGGRRRQAVILPQVTFGIAVRMAVMSMLPAAADSALNHDEIHIKNGRVIDPASGRPTRRPLHRRRPHRRRRQRPRRLRGRPHDRRRGLVVCPGLVDLSARLREPGFEYKATLESEMAAAMAGGVTSLACPPDTDPVLDEPGLVEMLKHRARSPNRAHVLSGRRADRGS
jgi:hypothetical protein